MQSSKYAIAIDNESGDEEDYVIDSNHSDDAGSIKRQLMNNVQLVALHQLIFI